MNSSSTKAGRLPFRHTQASVLLDLIRGIAAIMVLLMHARLLFFQDYSRLVHHNLFLYAFYAVTSAGMQAVLVFFVLSGYLIGGSVFRALEHHRWSWADYLLHRLTRLWLVLIPAMGMGAALDWFGMYHTHARPVYGGITSALMLHDVYAAFTPRIFLGNILFLQTLRVPYFGSNGALWSLANEFWYYMLFPLGLLALWKTTRPLHRAICILLFLLLAWRLAWPLLPYFIVWLAGVLLARMPVLHLSNSVRIAASILYLVIFLACGHRNILENVRLAYLFTAVTFLFFWMILSAATAARDNAFTRIARTLSGFSYTLYLVHTPLLVLLVALLLGTERWVPTSLHILCAAGILLGVMLYAWAIAACTEHHTHQVVAWIKARIGIS
jgi:peptidoglycan/LPS O-acetylase OafA/YrhL